MNFDGNLAVFMDSMSFKYFIEGRKKRPSRCNLYLLLKSYLWHSDAIGISNHDIELIEILTEMAFISPGISHREFKAMHNPFLLVGAIVALTFLLALQRLRKPSMRQLVVFVDVPVPFRLFGFRAKRVVVRRERY